MSNLPSATDIVAILKEKKIQHVRLIDSNHQMLTALANTGIEVMVGVPNDQLLCVGQSRSTAADLLSYYNSVKKSHHVRREGLEIPTLI